EPGVLAVLYLRGVWRYVGLDTDAAGLLPTREILPRPGSLPLQHDPLEHLHAPARTFDDLEMHAHRVARLEARYVAQLGALEVLNDVAHGKRAGRPTAKGSGMERDPIRLAEADSVGRPVDEEDDPDQFVAGHRAPGSGVARFSAVVPHHEVAVRRHRPRPAEVLAVRKSIFCG